MLALHQLTSAATWAAMQGLLWAMGFSGCSQPAGGKFKYWVRVPPPSRSQPPASLMGVVAAAAEELEDFRGLRGLTSLSRRGAGRNVDGVPAPAGPAGAGGPASVRAKPQGLWRRSVATAAEELWGLREEVQHLREHAVDAAITVAGTAAAAFAAQHPHGSQPQPWSPPPLMGRAPSSPLPGAAAASTVDAAAGNAATAAKCLPAQRANSAPAAAELPASPPEATAAVPPSPLEGRRITRAVAAAAAAAGSPLPPLPPTTAPRRRLRQPGWQGDSASSIAPDCTVRATVHATAPCEAAVPGVGVAGSSAGADAGTPPAGEGVPIVFLHGGGLVWATLIGGLMEGAPWKGPWEQPFEARPRLEAPLHPAPATGSCPPLVLFFSRLCMIPEACS
jgi:hypothetical protein